MMLPRDLSRLVRTTAFKLIAVYLVVFAVFAVGMISYVAWHTRALVESQVSDNVEGEVRFLAEQYRIGGIQRLIFVIDRRTRRPGSSIYLVTNFAGEVLASNVSELPIGLLDQQGARITSYKRSDEPGAKENLAYVQVFMLPGGYRLLVGKDVEDRDTLRQLVVRPAQGALVVILLLGLAGGIFVTRRVLKRIDAMTATSERIMAGDLSGRLSVDGSGDEFDRLAHSLNQMLDRIEALMAGLKEVSDNIAHDLKTPLTRLRNRAEEALRGARAEEDWRSALETTIEESEGLIRTFDALLMIARAEAGQARDTMVGVSLADITENVAELYEPLADEQGLDLVAEIQPVTLYGQRELLAQALSNLIDNAIKYGLPPDGARGRITVSLARDGAFAVLTVTDSGPGIPDADRDRVMERFVRLEASRSRPGSGLGLSLVAAVARLHGGQLSFSDAAPGLRATLRLPAKDG
ncbi:two-component sensor histidine kinase [Azorhizobium oxalatiphilum]|uniref:histidine kinase n=1 Tax=Azorhizobium oxalatiphilum TaxID=980631 RepID=A0A917F674_9HYPH|nr:ATP-binding protein [Azorhizobium oxalatiphilum]GGF53373.1 two-component sensor histidine kinase [Azorhizobium oxalatiphilum]